MKSEILILAIVYIHICTDSGIICKSLENHTSRFRMQVLQIMHELCMPYTQFFVTLLVHKH